MWGKNLLGSLGERKGDSRSTLMGLVQRRELYRKLAPSGGGWCGGVSMAVLHGGFLG